MNSIVLITGASRGIGRALAVAFGQRGDTVAVHYHSRRSEAEVTAKAVEEAGGRAGIFQGDIADPEQVKTLVDDVVKTWGRLDGLVANAGIAQDRSLFKMSPDDWRKVVDVNLSGTFWCVQAGVRVMARQKEGFVVVVGSIVGVRGGVGCANYAASKAGLLGLTRSVARECGRYNVRVNAVLPGFHATDMSEKIPDPQKQAVREKHLLNRTTDLKDLCRLVLAVVDSPSVSGQVFNADSRVL